MAIGESRREVRITWIGFAVIFTVIGSLLLRSRRFLRVFRRCGADGAPSSIPRMGEVGYGPCLV